MIRVQFNGKKSMQLAEFKNISPDVVQLTGNKIPKCTSGFRVYRLNGDFLGDYSDYNKIVEESENSLQLKR